MPTPLRDTTPEAEALLIRLAENMPLRRKLEIAESMTQAIRDAAMAGIRSRHPGVSNAEIRKRLAALLLPREIVKTVYGWDPRAEGY